MSMSKRECELYCHEQEWGYAHFYGDPTLVSFCDSGEADVLKVKVTEYKGKDPKYWGWWENEDKKFHFVWPSKGMVTMCSPDGFKGDTEKGEGKLCTVTIEVIGEASDGKK